MLKPILVDLAKLDTGKATFWNDASPWRLFENATRPSLVRADPDTMMPPGPSERLNVRPERIMPGVRRPVSRSRIDIIGFESAMVLRTDILALISRILDSRDASPDGSAETALVVAKEAAVLFADKIMYEGAARTAADTANTAPRANATANTLLRYSLSTSGLYDRGRNVSIYLEMGSYKRPVIERRPLVEIW